MSIVHIGPPAKIFDHDTYFYEADSRWRHAKVFFQEAGKSRKKHSTYLGHVPSKEQAERWIYETEHNLPHTVDLIPPGVVKETVTRYKIYERKDKATPFQVYQTSNTGSGSQALYKAGFKTREEAEAWVQKELERPPQPPRFRSTKPRTNIRPDPSFRRRSARGRHASEDGAAGEPALPMLLDDGDDDAWLEGLRKVAGEEESLGNLVAEYADEPGELTQEDLDFFGDEGSDPPEAPDSHDTAEAPASHDTTEAPPPSPPHEEPSPPPHASPSPSPPHASPSPSPPQASPVPPQMTWEEVKTLIATIGTDGRWSVVYPYSPSQVLLQHSLGNRLAFTYALLDTSLQGIRPGHLLREVAVVADIEGRTVNQKLYILNELLDGNVSKANVLAALRMRVSLFLAKQGVSARPSRDAATRLQTLTL